MVMDPKVAQQARDRAALNNTAASGGSTFGAPCTRIQPAGSVSVIAGGLNRADMGSRGTSPTCAVAFAASASSGAQATYAQAHHLDPDVVSCNGLKDGSCYKTSEGKAQHAYSPPEYMCPCR